MASRACRMTTKQNYRMRPGTGDVANVQHVQLSLSVGSKFPGHIRCERMQSVEQVVSDLMMWIVSLIRGDVDVN